MKIGCESIQREKTNYPTGLKEGRVQILPEFFQKQQMGAGNHHEMNQSVSYKGFLNQTFRQSFPADKCPVNIPEFTLQE